MQLPRPKSEDSRNSHPPQAKADIERLSAEITAATAAAAEKSAEIEAEKKSLVEAEKSLKDLISFREKQLAEFQSLEVEYML